MTDQYVTLRIWKNTMRELRLISGHLGESMVSIVARLVKREYKNTVRQLHDTYEEEMSSETDTGEKHSSANSVIS